MAGLSSNWKVLQAKLKAESASQPSLKRKSESQSQPSQPKRLKGPKPPTKSPGTKPRQKESHKARQMGGVYSSIQQNEHPHGHSPSLGLWAEDNDISSEAIAEAYDLGLKDSTVSLSSSQDKINNGLTANLELGKYVAIDCEMVGVGDGGYESVLARLSMVDFHGRQIYDSFVKPQEVVTDWRTPVSGIKPRDMKIARSFREVQEQASKILKDRVLIGHDVKHDLDVLMLSHPPRDIRDTAKYPGFKKYGNGRKPALRILAQELLHVEIQTGAHSSIEDARVAMLLFRKHKSGFDTDNATRFAPKGTGSKGQSRASKGKKNRKA